MTPPRVLFVLKKQDLVFYTAGSDGYSGYTSSPGLRISTQFVADMLNRIGVEA